MLICDKYQIVMSGSLDISSYMMITFHLFFQTIGACNYTLSHPTKETDWTEVSDDTLYFKPVKSHDHHLLGEKECTYGPAFWCASMENARKCNVSIGSLQYRYTKENINNFKFTINGKLSLGKLQINQRSYYNFLIQYFEADFLWKVSPKILSSGIILKTFTHVTQLRADDTAGYFK